MRLLAICGVVVALVAACSSGSGTADGNDGGSTGGSGGGGGKCTSIQDCPQVGVMCAYADCIQGQCQIVSTPGCGTGGSAGSAGDAGECVTNQDCPQPGAMCLYAECVEGTCQIQSTPGCGAGGAGGDAGGSCPTSEPTPSSACSVGQTGYCYYSSTICSCDAQGGFVQDGGASYAWDCGTAPAGCPSTVPTAGATCTDEGQSCSYDYRPCAQSNPSKFVCQSGVWVYSPTPCG